MKTTIKLNETQINTLVKSSQEQLSKEYELEVKKLKTIYDKKIEGLKKKFENFVVDVPDEQPVSERTRWVETELTRLKTLLKEGKKPTEISTILGKKITSVRQKMSQLKLKVKK